MRALFLLCVHYMATKGFFSPFSRVFFFLGKLSFFLSAYTGAQRVQTASPPADSGPEKMGCGEGGVGGWLTWG